MANITTPSFITEIPLQVDSKQDRELLARFQGGRQLMNACLNEGLVRMELVRKSVSAAYPQDKPYQKAKKISRNDKKQRQELFKQARQQYQFSEYDLHSFATIVAKSSKWIAKKVDSNTQQKIATRAFKAVEKILFGRASKIRFKVPSRFRSMEGKSNKTGIRWVNNQLVWGKLKIDPIIDWDNPVIVHGLNSRVKYCRILWRNINAKRRWYVQLINEGLAYQKPKNYVTDGFVGIDLNISNIAYVADKQSRLLPFADKVPTYQKEISAIQRKMQRSQRVSNPENYEPDSLKLVGNKIVIKKGKVKKGRKRWNHSNNYRKLRHKKAELERRKSSYARSQNRKVVNEILRQGNKIKTEKVSVKGWQKRYGKAISAKSPGFVQSELKRKAENAGGWFYKFSTQSTALSQMHLDGSKIKKSLSERVHKDVTGFEMHRDLFSAYLSRYVYDDLLSLKEAQSSFMGMEPSLVEGWELYKTANQVSAPERGNSHNSPERFSTKGTTSSQVVSKDKKLDGNA